MDIWEVCVFFLAVMGKRWQENSKMSLAIVYAFVRTMLELAVIMELYTHDWGIEAVM